MFLNAINYRFRISKSILALGLLFTLSGCGEPSDPEELIQRALASHAAGEYRAAMIDLKNVLKDEPENARARLYLGTVYVDTEQGSFAETELLRAGNLGIPRDQIVLLLAKSLLQQGKFEQLLRETSEFTFSSSSQDMELILLQGKAFLGMGDLVNAEGAFQKAADSNPPSVEGLIGLAEVALSKNDLESAFGLVEKALKQDPGSSKAWLVMGEIERRRDNADAAAKSFQKVVDIESEKKWSGTTLFLGRLGLTQMQLLQGEKEAAAKNLEWLSKTAPKHPAPKYFMALMAYQEGELEKADASLQEALRLSPKNTPALMLMGAVKFAQENFEQADMYLSALLSQNSDNMAARKLLATIRMRLNQPENALEALSPEVGQTDDDDLLALRAAAYRKLGDTDASIDLLEKALLSSPDNQSLQKDLLLGYINSGRYDEAVSLIEKTQFEQLTAAEAEYRKGLMVIQVYLKAKDSNRAFDRGKSLLEKRPDDPLVNNIVGGILATRGELDASRGYFEKAITKDPEFTPGWMNLGRIALKQDKPQQAERYFRRALENNGDNGAAMVMLAQLAEKQNNREEALKWLFKARESDAGSVEARLALIRYFRSKSDFQEAHKLAQEAVQAAPDSMDALYALGITQLWIKDFEQAKQSLEKVLKASPGASGAAYNLALAELGLKNTLSAKKHLLEVLRALPGHLPSVVLLAGIETQSGNAAKALELIGEQRKLHKNNELLSGLEGNILLSEKRFQEAAKAYRVAWNAAPSREVATNYYRAKQGAGLPNPTAPLTEWLNEHPDDTGVLIIRAQAYHVLGKRAAAIGDYERALERSPKNTIILNNLAWIYHEQRDARALELARQAYEAEPTSGAIGDTLGWLLVESGDIEQGISILQESVSKAPEIPDIHVHLAEAYVKGGDLDAARQVLEKALRKGVDLQGHPSLEDMIDKHASR